MYDMTPVILHLQRDGSEMVFHPGGALGGRIDGGDADKNFEKYTHPYSRIW